MIDLKERLKGYNLEKKEKYTFDNLVDVLRNTALTDEEIQELRDLGFLIGK